MDRVDLVVDNFNKAHGGLLRGQLKHRLVDTPKCFKGSTEFTDSSMSRPINSEKSVGLPLMSPPNDREMRYASGQATCARETV